MKTTIIATCLMTLAGCADAAEREPPRQLHHSLRCGGVGGV